MLRYIALALSFSVVGCPARLPAPEPAPDPCRHYVCQHEDGFEYDCICAPQ